MNMDCTIACSSAEEDGVKRKELGAREGVVLNMNQDCAMACSSEEKDGFKRKGLDACGGVVHGESLLKKNNPLLLEQLNTTKGIQPKFASLFDIVMKEDNPLLLLKEDYTDLYGDNRRSYPVEDMTSLIAATEAGNVPALLLLLKNGTDVWNRNNDMKTALHFAKSGGVVDILYEFGADIEAKDNDGNTPLRSAIQRNQAEVAEALLTLGARVDINTMSHWLEKMAGFTGRKHSSLGRFYHPGFVGCGGYFQRTNCFGGFGDYRTPLPCNFSYGITQNTQFPGMYNRLLDYTLAKKVKVLMIKFKQAGYKRYLTDLIIGESCDEADDLASQCLLEVEQMKKVMFGKLRLYDVLIKGITDCSYAANAEICQATETVEFKQNFPLYNSILRRQLRIAKRRNALLVELVKSFVPSLEECQNVKLPEEICLMIFSELSIADLINFNCALNQDFVVSRGKKFFCKT